MLIYKNIISSLVLAMLLSACNSTKSETNTNESTLKTQELTTLQSDKEFVSTLRNLATSTTPEVFEKEATQLIVPQLVRSYVLESYVEDVLALDSLQSENLLANEAYVNELTAFYTMANDTNKRAVESSDIYSVMDSITSYIYDIVYEYIFGKESVSQSDVNATNSAKVEVQDDADIVSVNSIEELKAKASSLTDSTYIQLNSSILQTENVDITNLSSDDIPLMPVRTFYKIFTGEEKLSYLAETSTGNPLSDALMMPVGRFVLIATGEESPSYAAAPTGNKLLDGLMAPVGIFFKVGTGEEDLTYISEASMGNPLFDTLMMPVGRFVLIATGNEKPSYAAAPTGNKLLDGLMAPVGIFFKVFTGEEELSYIAVASMGNPLFDTLMIPVGKFVLIGTGEEDLSYVIE